MKNLKDVAWKFDTVEELKEMVKRAEAFGIPVGRNAIYDREMTGKDWEYLWLTKGAKVLDTFAHLGGHEVVNTDEFIRIMREYAGVDKESDGFAEKAQEQIIDYNECNYHSFGNITDVLVKISVDHTTSINGDYRTFKGEGFSITIKVNN